MYKEGITVISERESVAVVSSCTKRELDRQFLFKPCGTSNNFFPILSSLVSSKQFQLEQKAERGMFEFPIFIGRRLQIRVKLMLK